MPPKRRRFVKKGAPKTKGYRKTGRTRRVKKGTSKGITVWTMPSNPKGHIPDRLYCTGYVENQFQSAIGEIGAAGANLLNYCTIYGNCTYEPFIGTGLPSNALTGLALTAASPGFGGANNTGYNNATNNINNFGVLLAAAGMYELCYVRSSTIYVDIDVGGLNDDGILYICPVWETVPTTARALGSSKHCKQIAMASYGNGLKNSLKNHAVTRELYGQSFNDEQMMSSGQYSHNNAGSLVQNWFWQVGYQKRSDGVSAAAMEFRIRVYYDMILYRPNQNVN